MSYWVEESILVSYSKDMIYNYLQNQNSKTIILDQTNNKYYDLETYSIEHNINQYSIDNYYTISYIDFLEENHDKIN
jgi:hypothetical protein